MRLYLDVETQSGADLDTVGTVNYARDPFARLNCIGYSVDGAAPVVIPRQFCTREAVYNAKLLEGTINPEKADPIMAFVQHFYDADYIVSHKAEFEIVVLREMLGLEKPLDQWICTMAKALYHGLPGSLDAAAQAAGCSVLKAVHLKANMLKLSNPMYTPEEFPAEFEKLYEYNKYDILSMVELDQRLPDLPPDVYENWVIDTHINMRGVPVDLQVIDNAIELKPICIAQANDEMSRLTGGYVTTCHQTKKIMEFMSANGLEMVDCAADTVEKLLGTYNGPHRRVLELRQEAGGIAISKYASMKAEHVNGRIYLAHNWYGTHTGRPTGGGTQMLNFPRPVSKEGSPYWADVIAHTPWFIPQVDRPLEKLKDGLRGAIKAAPGHILMGMDQSQAEAKATAFLSGDNVLMALFNTSDPYCTHASTMFGKPINKKDHPEERQAGKAGVLGGGFGGGIGALQRTGNKVNLDFDNMADVVLPAATDFEIMKGHRAYAYYRSKMPVKPLTERQGVACDVLKQWYRRDFKRVVAYWYELEEAFLNGGQAGPVHIEVRGNDRVVTLPSGRQLFYRDVRVHEANVEDEYGEVSRKVRYSYQARYHREWLWYGQLIENWAQAHSTDINNFYKKYIVKEMGHCIVHHCYDDITIEVPEHEQLWARWKLEEITKEFRPPFVGDTPLGFDFWQSERYGK